MSSDLRSKILAIQNDESLSNEQKAVKRQALLSGKWQAPPQTIISPGATHELNYLMQYASTVIFGFIISI